MDKLIKPIRYFALERPQLRAFSLILAGEMKINRYQAFGYHLLGSAFIGLCSAALVFLVWYPWPLPVATGVTEIFLVLLSVDIVIGPCITLIVFNPLKKELKRDLALVLVLQVCALLYGMHSVFVARPVYYVFNSDRFDLVYANDLNPEKLGKVRDVRFISVPLWSPKFVAARKPDNAQAKNEILFSALAGGDDLPQLPEYYVPYDDQNKLVQERLQSLDELKRFNMTREDEVVALISKYNSVPGGVGFLPLRGRIEDLTVVIRKDSAMVMEISDLKPWQ